MVTVTLICTWHIALVYIEHEGTRLISSTKISEVNVKNTFALHIDKKIFLTFLLTPYLYTFSLYENLFCRDGIYFDKIRNINFLRDQIRQIFL